MDLTKLMGILVYSSSHSSYFIEFDVYQQIAKIEECPQAKTNLSDVEQPKSTLNDVPEQIYPIFFKIFLAKLERTHPRHGTSKTRDRKTAKSSTITDGTFMSGVY
jgi:hypothetical protein